MSISITSETIGGESVYLLLAEPNTAAGIKATFAFETASSESVGGVESRRPVRSVFRIGLAYEFHAEEADLTLLRNLMGELGDTRVAIPFWPDWSAYSATALLDAQVTAGWDAGYTNIAIGEGGSTPAGAHTAPLIIGRLQRKGSQYFEISGATVTLTLLEESPWAMRLDAAGADPGATFTWDPHWVGEPEENTRDLLDFEQIGSGREQSVDGDTVTKWTQSAGFTLQRADLVSLLGWFAGRRGRFGAFTMAAFGDVGADTPAAPLDFNGTGGRGYMRLADDQITIAFLEHDLGALDLEFEQVLGQGTEQSPPTCILFEIWSDADPADISYLTDNEYPLTSNGEVWNPARIELKDLKSSMKFENDHAEVDVDLNDVPQVAPIIRHETLIPIRCRIRKADLSTDPATSAVLKFGKILKPRITGQRMSFEVKPFNGILERSIPRFNCSRTCNYSLFDDSCGADKAAFKIVGTLKFQWNGSWVRIVPLTTVPAGFGDNFLAGGWIEVGTGIDKQVRLIKENWDKPSGDNWATYPTDHSVHILLDRPLRLDVTPYGAAVVAYAGCDGSYATCVSKFSNGQKFGGAPFAPAWIWQRPMTFGGGGK